MDATMLETAILHRLHRLQGQIGGLTRMYEDERPALELLDQIAAIRGALTSLGLEIVSRDLAARLDGTKAKSPSALLDTPAPASTADDPCALVRHLLHIT